MNKIVFHWDFWVLYRENKTGFYYYFVGISRGLGGLKTNFNNIASSIRTHLKKALSDPELVNLQKVADEVNKLTKQFKKFEAKRELATKWFSTKTTMMDP